MENNPLGITRDEILQLAATKLVDAYVGDPDLSETAEQMIRKRIEELFASGLSEKINTFLTSEMEKIVGQEIVPVNIWGDREGKPTTIRAELARRAKEFWEVRVDENGRESHYGGTPRNQQLMKSLLKDTFAEAVKSNAELIVSEFKSALKVDATKLVNEHIDKLINVRTW